MVASLAVRRPASIRKLSSSELGRMRILDRIARTDGESPFSGTGDLDNAVYLIEKWPIFCPGPWDGGPKKDGSSEWTAKDCRDLNDNFHTFSGNLNSDHPFLVPKVTFQHDNRFVSGWVVDSGMDDNWLWVSLAVNHPMALAIDTLLVDQASIEFWDTYREDVRTRGGFPQKKDGKPWGLIMQAVTMCGGQPPAVRGQPKPPRPVRVFSDQAATGRVTVEISKMNPTTLDPSVAALLQGMVTQIQAVLSGGNPTSHDAPSPTMPGDTPVTMTDDAMTGDMPAIPQGLDPAATRAFTDFTARAKKQSAAINTLTTQVTTMAKVTEQLAKHAADQAKRDADAITALHAGQVREFLDSTAVKSRIGGGEHRVGWEKILLENPAEFQAKKDLMLSLPVNSIGQRQFQQPVPTVFTEGEDVKVDTNKLLSTTEMGRKAIQRTERRNALRKQQAANN